MPLFSVGLVIQGSNSDLNKKFASPSNSSKWMSDPIPSDSIHSHFISTVKEILRVKENLYWIMEQEEFRDKIIHKLGISDFTILSVCSRNPRNDI